MTCARALDLRVIAALEEIRVDVAVTDDAVLRAIDREHVALELLVEARIDRQVSRSASKRSQRLRALPRRFCVREIERWAAA